MAELEKLKPAAADLEQPKEEPPNDEQPKAARKPFWEKPVSPTDAEKAAAKAEKRAKWRAEREKEADLKDKEAELKWEREAEARAIKAGRPPGAPKLPEGKGRPKRFASKKLNSSRPFIERNIAPIVKDKPPVQAVPPVPAPVPEAELTVEPQPKPSPPTDDSDDKKLPPLDVVAAVTTPAAEECLPVSPPDRPPRTMRLADDKDAVTLHHVLRVVNDALRTEMGRDPDVYAALAQEIQGPLRVLDDLGRLVRLLFLSMDKHREQLWREKKAAIRAAKEAAEQAAAEAAADGDADNDAEAEENVTRAVIKSIMRKPWPGAVSMFSTPIRELAPTPRDRIVGVFEKEKKPKGEDDGDEEADENEENNEDGEKEGEEEGEENDEKNDDGEDGEDDEKDGDGESKEKEKEKKENEKKKRDEEDHMLYSLMGPGFFKNGVNSDDDDEDDDNDDDPDSDKDSLISQAFQRVDSRNVNILRSKADLKRDHGTVFHDPDDLDESMSDSDSDSENELHGKFPWNYLTNRSPSLGSKFPKFESLLDPLDPRRHEMFDIEERRYEEAVENKKTRLAARDARRKAIEDAQAKIDTANAEREAELAKAREEASNAATESVKKQLADLEDERDAALQLAKIAVYERDEIDAGREDREREMDQLRTLVRELIDREFAQSDGEEEEKEKKGRKEDEKAKEDVEEKKNEVEGKEGDVKEGKQGEKKEEERPKDGHPTEDKKSEADLTETDPLPDLPTAADLMGRASRRSSRHFDRLSMPSDIPMPLLTPLAPTTPIFPSVPPIPSTPMTKWDRQLLIDEVERILRATVPPPTPITQQFNQRPPPPSPAPRRRSSTKKGGAAYHIKKVRAPLGEGFLASFFDILLAILFLVTRQKSNSETVGSYIWYKYAVPTYLPLKKLVLRMEGRLLSSRSQPQQTDRSANLPEGETILTGQPFVTTPAPFPTTMASQHNKSSRTALASMYRHELRRAYFVFPRDAIAELFVFVFVTFAGFCLASAIRERNLWLDANNTATDPAWYVYYLRRHQQEMVSCTASPATPPSYGPGSHHICACLPTYVDPRMITWPLAYMWNVWLDRAQDYLWQAHLSSRLSVGWF